MSVPTIELVQFSNYLGTAELGIQTYKRIDEYWEATEQIQIDFQDILGMTGAFADEAFGKMFIRRGSRDYINKMNFLNLNEVVEVILKYTLYKRYEQTNGNIGWLN